MNRIVFLFVVFSVCSFSQKTGVQISVTNPINITRTIETVELQLSVLYQLYPELQGKQISVFDGTKELVTQLVDEDVNGYDDVLLFQTSFKPKEKKQFTVQAVNNKLQAQTAVDVRYTLPREDVAWENDRIAFRIYGNVIAGNVDNGIDVWTKRVRYPIVEKWYKGEEQTPVISYHEDHGEGADFFSVGKSLGGGSAGILWNGKLMQGGLFTHHRVITNGPIRASFEVYYPNWKLDTAKFLQIKKISIDAGEQLNKIEEQFISNSSIQTLTLASGLVKRKFTEAKRSADNRRLSLWGLTTQDSINGYLGTAVVFPFSKTTSAVEDSLHYLISTLFNKKNSITYFSGAAWSRLGDITTEQEWIHYLDEYIVRKNNPLIILYQQQKK